MSGDSRSFKHALNKLGNKLSGGSSESLIENVNYNFMSGIVKDVISNPYDYINREIEKPATILEKIRIRDVSSGRIKKVSIIPGVSERSADIDIKNSEKLENAPMNSAIVYLIDDGRAKDGEKPVLCYPFFPPHISLPLKAGEYVWIIKEDIRGSEHYYWMCRKVGIRQVDDINFTNLERTPEINAAYDTFAKTKQATPASILKALASNFKAGKSNLPDTKDFRNLFVNSVSHVEEFTGEPVPRVLKKCGDTLIHF